MLFSQRNKYFVKNMNKNNCFFKKLYFNFFSLEIEQQKLTKYGVCKKHFPDTTHKFTAKKLVLKEGTIPSLNLTQENSRTSENVDINDNYDRQLPNTYSVEVSRKRTINDDEDKENISLVAKKRKKSTNDEDTLIKDSQNCSEGQLIFNNAKLSTNSLRKKKITTTARKRKPLKILQDAKRIKNLTPREKFMYAEICKLKKGNLNLRKQLQEERLKKQNILKKQNENFEDFLSDLTPVQRDFVKMMKKNMSRKKQVYFTVLILIISNMKY